MALSNNLEDVPSSFPHASDFASLDLDLIGTPVYITDKTLLEKNLKLLLKLQKESGVKVLIALKAFALHKLFPMINDYLKGASASSLFEARLAKEKINGEIHSYAPAYPDKDFPELLQYVDHVIFNSFQQLHRFLPQVQKATKKKSVGMRINPEHSEVKVAIYNPCALGSRLGVRRADFLADELSKLDGLHFHNLCELNSDALARTWTSVEAKFGEFLGQLKWLNLGGGHLITHPQYDLEVLKKVIANIKDKYPNLEVYLEPGEAISYNCGIVAASVLDIVPFGDTSSKAKSVILDFSPTAHAPDIIEMPYRPTVFSDGAFGREANQQSEDEHRYRLGGVSCLSGDIIGDYLFNDELKIGQKLFFGDMAHYTMVKNTHFNGIRPPAIAVSNIASGELELCKNFEYEDYKNRLS